MNKVCAGLLCVIMLVAFGSEAFAADWRKGKRTYRSVCMSCHKTTGEAGRLSLESRSRDEWSAFFAREPGSVHKKAWGNLNGKDMDNLEMYFRKYAKNIKSNLGCG